MGNDGERDAAPEGECIVHTHPVPPAELGRYSIDSDPHSEMDIANYVGGQARDETIQHVEKIKQEIVLGDTYEIWDVTTDKDRWWVITNLTNLYPQKHFPSLDYTLSFHIGLMMRLRSRSDRIDGSDPSPFDEVLRRQPAPLTSTLGSGSRRAGLRRLHWSARVLSLLGERQAASHPRSRLVRSSQREYRMGPH